MTDDVSETAPEGGEAPERGSRYAAYDLELLRYVGGVHPTKSKAREAVKGNPYRTEIREV